MCCDAMVRPHFSLLGYQGSEWLKNLKTPLTAKDAMRLMDVRRRVKITLDELTLLAATLSEEQLSQIFSAKDLQPLIHNLVGMDLKQKRTDRHYEVASLLAFYSLKVCKDKTLERNPDVFRLVDRTFDDVRGMLRHYLPSQIIVRLKELGVFY